VESPRLIISGWDRGEAFAIGVSAHIQRFCRKYFALTKRSERYNVVNLIQQSIMKAYELEAIVETDGKVQFPDFSIDNDSLF
jgi:hypothetical protein